MSVNHLTEFEAAVNKFIDETSDDIARASNKTQKNEAVTKKSKKQISEFARAQVEVLTYLKSALPKIKEAVEYMR